MSRLTLVNGGHVAYAWVTDEDFAELGVLPEEAESLPDAVRVLGGIDVAMLLRQAGDEVRVQPARQDRLRRRRGRARTSAAAATAPPSGFTFSGTIAELLPQLLAAAARRRRGVSARRGATDLSGILAIDKPAGMTSHDVVDRVRRVTGERRVGHAGTLDPMATGLLVVLVGPATRLAPYLTAAEKTYDARIVFGAETDTDDAEGRVTATAPVPDEVGDPFFAAGTVASLVGTHEQVPPAFSAIKRGGVTAYEAARKGEALELEPRTIEVDRRRLLGVECVGEYAWDVEFAVSKGTYIRALARDLGRALDTAAHLGALRRTRSGTLALAQAHTLEERRGHRRRARRSSPTRSPRSACRSSKSTPNGRARRDRRGDPLDATSGDAATSQPLLTAGAPHTGRPSVRGTRT